MNASHDAGLPDGLAYPIAVGRASCKKNLDLHATLQSYLQAFAATLISVGVRIIPIGQQAGQDCLISLYPVIGEVSTEAATATLSELGSASMLSDLMAIKHENATPRIYRT